MKSFISKKVLISTHVLFTLNSLCIWSCSAPEKEITSEENSTELSLKKLVIALKANKQPASMLIEKQELQAYLSQKLNRPIEVLIPTDSSIVVESFRNGIAVDSTISAATDALSECKRAQRRRRRLEQRHALRVPRWVYRPSVTPRAPVLAQTLTHHRARVCLNRTSFLRRVV